MLTTEVGTRFSSFTWEHRVRPDFDARAAFAQIYDNFAISLGPAAGGGSSSQSSNPVGRSSRGFGGIAETGLEYSLTNTFALTTGLAAMRSRMTTYDLGGSAVIPTGASYWTTSVRYTLGFSFSPVRVLH